MGFWEKGVPSLRVPSEDTKGHWEGDIQSLHPSRIWVYCSSQPTLSKEHIFLLLLNSWLTVLPSSSFWNLLFQSTKTKSVVEVMTWRNWRQSIALCPSSGACWVHLGNLDASSQNTPQGTEASSYQLDNLRQHQTVLKEGQSTFPSMWPEKTTSKFLEEMYWIIQAGR